MALPVVVSLLEFVQEETAPDDDTRNVYMADSVMPTLANSNRGFTFDDLPCAKSLSLNFYVDSMIPQPDIVPLAVPRVAFSQSLRLLGLQNR
jgi:hypothetical protein